MPFQVTPEIPAFPRGKARQTRLPSPQTGERHGNLKEKMGRDEPENRRSLQERKDSRMRNTSTRTGTEFLLESLWEGLCLWLLYQKGLFRCLPGWTYGRSVLLLTGMQIGMLLLSDYLLFRHHRTGGTQCAALFLPYGVYTLLIYRRELEWAGWALPAVCAGLALGYTVLCMAQKIPDSGRKACILKNRAYRCWWVSWELLAAGAVLLVGGLFLNFVLGLNLFLPVVQPTVETNAAVNTRTLEGCAVELQPLREGIWKTLSIRRKLDMLQKVANLEVQELGLPQELRVGGSVLGENVLAEYEDRTHTIRVSLDLLEEGSSGMVLDALLHECYHAYQHQLAELYKAESDPAVLQLKVFRTAAQYAYEFSHYEDEDLQAYYEQACEMDARSYAWERKSIYSECIRSVIVEQRPVEIVSASEAAS